MNYSKLSILIFLVTLAPASVDAVMKLENLCYHSMRAHWSHTANYCKNLTVHIPLAILRSPILIHTCRVHPRNPYWPPMLTTNIDHPIPSDMNVEKWIDWVGRSVAWKLIWIYRSWFWRGRYYYVEIWFTRYCGLLVCYLFVYCFNWPSYNGVSLSESWNTHDIEYSASLRGPLQVISVISDFTL